MSQANNRADLYDLESHYEDALAAYYQNANIGFAQILTPRTPKSSAEELKTPRLQIRAGITGVLADGSGLKEDFGPNNSSYLSYYGLAITLDVITNRSNSNQAHGLMRGATRVGMLEMTASMNNTSLPFYQTVQVTPQGSVQAIDAVNDEIQTQMAFALEVFIPPASFPNS